MPSMYSLALAETVAAARERNGWTRRDLGHALSKGNLFTPSYTLLTRVDEGTRALRVTELKAIADALGVEDLSTLIPNPRRRAFVSDLRAATLDLTVEQVVGLAEVLDRDPAELLQTVAEVTSELAQKESVRKKRADR